MKIKLHICVFFTLLEKKIDCKIAIIQEGLFETNTVDVFFPKACSYTFYVINAAVFESPLE